MSDVIKIRTLQDGIEHYEALTGNKPSEVQMPQGLMDELMCDPDFALCTEIQDPCAEYSLRGVKLVVVNILNDEAVML